jgi:hypothetical protein
MDEQLRVLEVLAVAAMVLTNKVLILQRVEPQTQEVARVEAILVLLMQITEVLELLSFAMLFNERSI